MTKMICSNCHKPIGKFGAISPTTDKRRRQQCLKCADKWMESKQVKVKWEVKPEWEKELWFRLRYLDLPEKYDAGLVNFIRQAIQTEVKREGKRMVEEIKPLGIGNEKYAAKELWEGYNQAIKKVLFLLKP